MEAVEGSRIDRIFSMTIKLKRNRELESTSGKPIHIHLLTWYLYLYPLEFLQEDVKTFFNRNS